MSVVLKAESHSMKAYTGEVGQIPGVDPLYVPWGHYDDIKAAIKSKMFYNIFITGLSGNGKTTMVEQICAELSRNLFRVNIIFETDETDLFGGFRLVNGSTDWFDGPVVRAMETGSVLLLDEIDLGSVKIMCLQPVLEGKPIYLKKVGRMVYPAPGFTVIATGNTKGRGSEDGKFVGTQVLNEAFLDRFPATIEQTYPPVDIERDILLRVAAKCGIEEEKSIFHTEVMISWALDIRNRYTEGSVDEVLSTRRLVDILRGYAIFGSFESAIEKSIARFDTGTKDSFLEFYKLHFDEETKMMQRKLRGEENTPEPKKSKGVVHGTILDEQDVRDAKPGDTLFTQTMV